MYEYHAVVTRVVDADTLDVLIDLGLGVHVATRVRLWGLNAPELKTPEGKAAKDYAGAWLRANGTPEAPFPVLVYTYKDSREKYGRYLATVWDRSKTRTLNGDLVAAGHARLR